MTVTERPRATTRDNVVHEIAARRLADVRPELDALGRAGLARMVAAAQPPRPVAEALAQPGLHLIAEVKRRSPSAGSIAVGDDAVARARAYVAGGATAISVLCEPHWFGGSVDDLRAVRAAVSVPVLAKEFVVDARQLDVLRAAGADLVLLLAVLHPARRLARLVAQARNLGLEPLVEAHDARELDAVLATDARVIGINNRDLRTLDVDPERAVGLRELVPEDRLIVAESGVRDVATIARWRAIGFDAALVGEVLMRASDPAAAARACVGAGRYPLDAAAAARSPMVKICGVTDEAGVIAAVRSGAEAIGLNFAPGTPRELTLDEGAALASLARRMGGPAHPLVVLVTADLPVDALAGAVAAVDPDVVQLSGDETTGYVAAVGRPVWKALRLSAGDSATHVVERAQAYVAAGASRILLNSAGGPHPGGTGIRIPADLAAAVAREVPVVLAGGLNPGNVGGAVLAVPAVGVDTASGTDLPRVPGERPSKDPVRVALFVKRARDARRHRPNDAFGPTPVHPGLLEVDGGGRWGKERDFGGRYVPETLVGALQQLEDAYDALRHDPRFWAELDDLLANYAGRPTALYRADRLATAVADEARRIVAGRRRTVAIPAFRLYLKREDLAHTGAHKINNALGQALLTRRLGKSRVIAETGAGQHGVATATACALLGLPVRGVHGRGGHPPPGTERAPDARPGRRGPQRDVRHGDAQGRGQRGDARLGHQRRDHALRAGIRDGTAPVPDDRPRPPAPDRRRGRRAAVGGRGPATRPGAGLRRRRVERDRPALPVHRRALGAAGGGRGGGRWRGDRAPRGRDRRWHAGDPPRRAVADAPGP